VPRLSREAELTAGWADCVPDHDCPRDSRGFDALTIGNAVAGLPPDQNALVLFGLRHIRRSVSKMIETQEYHPQSEIYVHATCHRRAGKMIVRQRQRGRPTSIAPIP